MARQIRVLYVIDHLYGDAGGGTEQHLLQLVRLLDRKRFLPGIVGLDVGDTPVTRAIQSAGVELTHFPIGRYYTPAAILRTLALARLIRGRNPDIVQTFHFKSDFLGVLAARRAGVQRIISSRRDMGDTKKWWQLTLNRRVNGLLQGCIAVCNAVGEALVARESMPRERITRIYNGVDTRRFFPPDAQSRQNLRSSLDIGSEDFVIGVVAVFRPEKGYDIFVEAIRSLRDRIPRLRAIAIGGGPNLEAERSRCRKIGLGDTILFPGAVQNVERLLGMCDVACFVPSHNEGFSNALLEKMSCGLPVVATDVGGNREAIVDGSSGLLIPPGDVQRLMEALFHLYSNPALRAEMGHCARKLVEERFTLERMIDAHATYYTRLVGLSE